MTATPARPRRSTTTPSRARPAVSVPTRRNRGVFGCFGDHRSQHDQRQRMQRPGSMGAAQTGSTTISVVGHSHDRGCLVDCGLTQQAERERRRYHHRHRGLHNRPQRRGLPLLGIATDYGNAAQVDHNSTTGGIYGIYEFGGTGTFSHNSASGSSGVDLWRDGTGTPTFSHNSCGTASPSKAIWGRH